MAGKGFVAMTPEQRAEVGRRGGQTSQARGTAYRWDEDGARAAGRKGGLKSKALQARQVQAQRRAEANEDDDADASSSAPPSADDEQQKEAKTS